MARKIAFEIICFLYILLFVYAAVSKLLDLEDFVLQIQRSPVLSWLRPASYPIGVVIPVAELVIAGLLLIPAFRSLALWSAFGLMVVFTLYIIAIVFLAPYVPCKCGGVLESLGWSEHFIFNMIFGILALVGIRLRSGLLSEKEVSNLI